MIRIEILDVDEPPAFQNGPKPYQAVVAYDQPVGMHVYKVNFEGTISEFFFFFAEENGQNVFIRK